MLDEFSIVTSTFSADTSDTIDLFITTYGRSLIWIFGSLLGYAIFVMLYKTARRGWREAKKMV